MKIIIVGSTHGHEKIGLRVIEELRNLNLDSNQVEFIVGNPKASELSVPFTESDLNRIFPGKPDGNYEEKRAFELSEKIINADIVIDIHSTKTTDLSNNSMIIVTKFDEATKQVLSIISPPKILVMRYKSTNALISQAKIGIAFEYGLDDSETVLSATLHDIIVILIEYKLIQHNPYVNLRVKTNSVIFDVYDAFMKNFNGDYVLSKKVENFKQVHRGEVVCITKSNKDIFAEEDFYPILFGNNRYKDILGFKAQKIS